MLSTDAVVDWALASTLSFLFKRSASPAPYTMYTAPVPPVTMLSVFPVKLGAPDADGVGVEAARGALQAAVMTSAATRGARNRVALRMCTSPAVGAAV